MFRQLAICCVLCAGCGDAHGGSSGKAEAADLHVGQSGPRKVRMQRVSATNLARAIAVSGTLAADERVTIGVKVSGRLATIAVDLGSTVHAGDEIARIDTTDYELRVQQAASAVGQARALLGLDPNGTSEDVNIDQASIVLQARAGLDQAAMRQQRALALFDKKLIAQAELDTANTAFVNSQSAFASARDEVRNRQASLRQRRTEVASARQVLADAVVRSPMDGSVEARLANPGQFLAVAAPVATLVRTDPLRLRVEISERDAQSVHMGQEVRVRVAGRQEVFNGKVARLSPTINEQNRTLVIEAEVRNPGSLRPGTFASADILMEGDDEVNAVPSSSVVTFAGIEKVIMVKDGKAVERVIATGRRDGKWTEVLSGVQLGDAVVLEPGNLQEGQPVAIDTSAAPQEQAAAVEPQKAD